MTIMEDDALCTGDLDNAVATMEATSENSSVVLLGGLYDESRTGLHPLTHFQMLHAYVIWPEAARKLLDSAFPISKQVDWYMMDVLHGTLQGFTPSVFEQNPAVYWTDIQTDIKPAPLHLKSKRFFTTLLILTIVLSIVASLF